MDKRFTFLKPNRIKSKDIESKFEGSKKVPVLNTAENKQSTRKEVLKNYNGFNGQFSKPKQAKAAIVKSFSFAAVSKKLVNRQTECSPTSDQDIKNNFKMTMDLNGNIPGTKNEEDFKEPSKQGSQICKLEDYVRSPISKTKLTKKTSVKSPKNDAHSGIPFLASPRRAIPNPFSSGEKRKQSLWYKAEVLPKSNLNSKQLIGKAANAFNSHPFVRKVQSHEIQPKTILAEKSKSMKQVTPIHQRLADLATSVHKAPIVQRNYDGHSGIPFTLRKSPRTSNNPFIMGTSSEESGANALNHR